MSKPTAKLAMAYSTIATMEARIKELECQRPAGVAVPDGWALVPAEPTEQMISAGSEAAHAGGCDLYRMKREVMNAWPAMLAAAPHPVSGEQKWSSFEEWLAWEIDQGDGTSAPVSDQQSALAKRLWSCIASNRAKHGEKPS